MKPALDITQKINARLIHRKLIDAVKRFNDDPSYYYPYLDETRGRYTLQDAFLWEEGRNLISNKIHDMFVVHSGYVQDVLLDREGYLPLPAQRVMLYLYNNPHHISDDGSYKDQIKEATTIVHEHYNSRQAVGEKIVEQALCNPDFSVDDLHSILIESVKVHYVTASANRALSTTQNKYKGLPWREQYQLTQVVVKLSKGTRNRFVFFVGDQYYGNNAELFAAYPELTASQIMKRFETKKWQDLGYRRVEYIDYIRSK